MPMPTGAAVDAYGSAATGGAEGPAGGADSPADGGATPTMVPLSFEAGLGGAEGGGGTAGAPGAGAGGADAFIISMVPLNFAGAPAAGALSAVPHFEQLVAPSGFWAPQFGQNTWGSPQDKGGCRLDKANARRSITALRGFRQAPWLTFDANGPKPVAEGKPLPLKPVRQRVQKTAANDTEGAKGNAA
jgi:hypothetical protein